VINAIPKELKLSISAGIGLFLIIIGLENVGLVVDDPATLVTMGDVRSLPMLLALVGFLTICALDALKIPGSVLVGILGVTVLGTLLGLSEFTGVVSAPPDVTPTLFQLDIAGALNLALVTVIIAFFFGDLFDTAGTLVGVAHKAGLLDKDGRLPRLRKALLADSAAAMIGASIGTSSVTSYVESVAGVKAGGRTGLTAVVVGLLFLAALFLAPLAGAVQSYATAPALVFVGCVMAGSLAQVDWEDPTRYVPAVVTAIAMPLTYSIATGIGLGFIVYAALKLLTGRWREANVGVVVLAVLFALKFVFIDSAQ
jgi:AGZA family xanthine/uracil permease-like MFS transporter